MYIMIDCNVNVPDLSMHVNIFFLHTYEIYTIVHFCLLLLNGKSTIKVQIFYVLFQLKWRPSF